MRGFLLIVLSFLVSLVGITGTTPAAAALPAVATVNEAALLAPRPARKISTYNLFRDNAAQVPNEGLHPYDLAIPLFTDYAHKHRFVYVPKGKSAAYNEREALEFPVGSVLVKTFSYPADFRKPDEDIRLVETRLLIRQDTGWAAWAYVWNEDMTDADLKVAGKTLPVSWTDKAGETRSIQYVVPNRNQCKGCHVIGHEFSPIGPKARNLNFTYGYPEGVANQLEYWTTHGLLEGAPQPEDAPRVPRFDDVSVPVADRARAYLDINCAHCHRAEGPGSTSGLFLTWWETNKTTWGYRKRPVAAGRGSGGLTYDIEPGKPEESILIYRLNSTDPGVMMPEVGRTTVHDEGLALLKEWIKGLD